MLKIKVGSKVCLSVAEEVSNSGDAWFTVSSANEDGSFECVLPAPHHSVEDIWETVPANGDGILDFIR